MSSRCLCVCWHKYTPYGSSYYEPILTFFLQQMQKFENEYDMIYLIDSNWEIDIKKIEGMKAKIIRVNPSLRYYEAYKEVLPQIKEDLVLFLDNDFLIFQKWPLNNAFHVLSMGDRCIHGIGNNICTDCWNVGVRFQKYDIVSIIDTIGTMKVPLEKGNKCCPYFFATKKELLMKYLDIDWGPDAMPYTETFGLLTEAILKDGFHVYEIKDNKSNILFDGTQDEPKKTNFYHIRAGSTPAYLLATKEYGNIDTYNDYLKNQPKSEFLRQACWYQYMGGNPLSIIIDSGLAKETWDNYYQKFLNYHGLI